MEEMPQSAPQVPVEPQAAQPPINQPPVQPTPQPVQAPQQPVQPAPAQPAEKKSHAWAWVLGGCLSIILLAIIAALVLGWWGVRKVKKEIENNTTVENMKNNIDKMNQEGEKWQKESEKIRESMPNPEDIPKSLPSNK